MTEWHPLDSYSIGCWESESTKKHCIYSKSHFKSILLFGCRTTGSYRHIALISCLCKTMERMVNSRLTWYLERHMVITEFQSGFRKRRSTVDNFVILETSIRDAFVGRKYLVFIFLIWRMLMILLGNMVFY